MKFDKPISIDRGVAYLLRTADGQIVGGIANNFLPSRQGLFAANRRGYLTASARVSDPKTGQEITVAEWTNSSCHTRAEADKAFRKWIRENDIRAKVIAAAEQLRAAAEQPAP